MKWGLTLLYIWMAGMLVVGCSSIDCPLNNSVYSYYYLYKADGTPDTLSDSLSILTRRLTPEHDGVLINQDTKVSVLQVAMSYENPQDELYFVMHGTRSYNDTLVTDSGTFVNTITYRLEKMDTVVVKKSDEMHFESVDCNPSFFHTITDISYTKNIIDSIVINNPKVDYDSQTEHFRIYFRSLD